MNHNDYKRSKRIIEKKARGGRCITMHIAPDGHAEFVIGARLRASDVVWASMLLDREARSW